MKEWKLDFDKCVEFGSDGASTIIGKQNEVIARLKKEGKSFFNLRLLCGTQNKFTAIDATKVGPYKDISREINALLNLVAVHLKKSCKIKSAFLLLQEELVDL